MAYITDATLVDAVKAANSHAANPLPDHWDNIVPRANRYAYGRIRSVLIGRGFSATQVDAWGATDDGQDWNERIGIVEAFIQASKADPEALAAFRDELKALMEEFATYAIIIDDDQAVPDNGRITTGTFDTSSDRWTLDDPDGSGDFSPPSESTEL